jgi:DMSO/TMAO reductase YedYZ molybdopterin-dependent catalytic subunit
MPALRVPIMVRRITRRQFLMWGTIGAASLLVPELSACSPSSPDPANPGTPTLPAPASATPTAPIAITPTRCKLSPLAAPTRPADTPGYTMLDTATGLHMTGTPVDIDVNMYRLKVTGKVKNELSLSYDDLRCMPKTTTKSTSICAGYFEDRATWAGVPFSHIFELAGVKPEASLITLFGADGYQSGTRIEAALLPTAYLAYEWEGQPVPVLHGFPLRAIFDSVTGGFRVKWLLGIEVS